MLAFAARPTLDGAARGDRKYFGSRFANDSSSAWRTAANCSADHPAVGNGHAAYDGDEPGPIVGPGAAEARPYMPVVDRSTGPAGPGLPTQIRCSKKILQ